MSGIKYPKFKDGDKLHLAVLILEANAFKIEIITAINAAKQSEEGLSFKEILRNLTPLTIENYDDSPSNTYKSTWNSRIHQMLRILDVPFLSSSSAGFVSNTKQEKLLPIDKENIKLLYSKLDPAKMWKLSSGVLVEKKMEEFALKCNYEHPCHSIIFDSNDKCWEDVFASEDLQEIKTYRLKQLDDLPVDLQEYVDSYKSINEIDGLFEKVKKDVFHPLKESSCEWAQAIIYSYLKLYMFNYFPLNDQTETDIFLRIWSLIDTVFVSCLVINDTFITSLFDLSSDHVRLCNRGEKSSNASADGRNIDNTIASTDQIERKLPGRKVNMLFKANSMEFGCVDCGRFSVFSNTKEFLFDQKQQSSISKDWSADLHRQAMCTLKINEPPKPMNSTVWCMDFGLTSHDDWMTQLSKAATYLVIAISMKNMVDIHTIQTVIQLLPLCKRIPNSSIENSYVHNYIAPILQPIFAAVERLYSRSIVKSFLDTHTKKETRRKRTEYEDRGKNTLNDGYADQELLRINQYFLIQNNIFSLRNKVCFSMSHAMLMRSETALGTQLPDLFIMELKNQGPSSCFAIVATITFGKTNKDGKIQYGSALRHRDVEVYPHGAFAQYFFSLFHHQNLPFPNFSTRRDWYDTYLFPNATGDGSITYSEQAKIYKQVLRYCGVYSSKLTHINRKSAINMVANEGVSGDQQRQVGRWGSDRMVGCYLSGLPVDAIKVLAGFTTRKGDYFINRGSIEPSEELRKMI
ncbi:hypothetical protein G6F55_009633 [Rhizopus delemar]|nr:hypothetical protein G6F55_009633 [Rhizopus delemar]